jgi:uncharacterized protein
MIEKTLQKELNLADWQVEKVIRLIDDGNTIPFIARYRKDITGSLNDETLRKFDERLRYLRNLEDKKEKIVKRIAELGKLDDDLKTKIMNGNRTSRSLREWKGPSKSTRTLWSA